jgi:transposase-like protein
MDRTAFETWLGGISTLTASQRRRAGQAFGISGAPDRTDSKTATAADQGSSRIERTADEPRPAPKLPPVNPGGAANVADLAQRRADKVACPHCECRDVVRWGKASALSRNKCNACLRTFNALTKTPLAHLRMKDKWATRATAMIDGVSTTEAAQQCGVHYTTAARWENRFTAALAGDNPQTLSDIVAANGTLIPESFKGKPSDTPRKSRKRGGKPARRGLSA